MTVSSFHLGHHSSKFFLFPVENYADMLSTANTGHTATQACCGPTRALPNAWEDADADATAA